MASHDFIEKMRMAEIERARSERLQKAWKRRFLAEARGALESYKFIPWYQPIDKLKCFIGARLAYGHLIKELRENE